MNDPRRVTQKRLAEHLGLDQRTVSQALAGRPGIAAATRERVRAAAEALGYFPNASARAMRGGRQRRIALLTSTAARYSHLPAARLAGMQAAAQEAGVGFGLVAVPQVDLADHGRAAAVVAAFAADGLLLNYGRDSADEVRGLLARFHVPAVAVNSPLAADAVHLDDHGIARAAVLHLAARGATRIAYVPYGPRVDRDQPGGMAARHASEPARAAGTQAGAAEAGLPCALVPVEAVADRIGELLAPARPGDRPAVLCYDTLTGLRVHTARLAAGLGLAGPPAVFHFAEQPFWDDALDAVLRAIVLPEYALGLAAVRLLLARLAGGAPQPAQAVGIEADRLAFASDGGSYRDLPPPAEWRP